MHKWFAACHAIVPRFCDEGGSGLLANPFGVPATAGACPLVNPFGAVALSR